jgi:hypothetical protein
VNCRYHHATHEFAPACHHDSAKAKNTHCLGTHTSSAFLSTISKCQDSIILHIHSITFFLSAIQKPFLILFHASSSHKYLFSRLSSRFFHDSFKSRISFDDSKKSLISCCFFVRCFSFDLFTISCLSSCLSFIVSAILYHHIPNVDSAIASFIILSLKKLDIFHVFLHFSSCSLPILSQIALSHASIKWYPHFKLCQTIFAHHFKTFHAHLTAFLPRYHALTICSSDFLEYF